MWFEPRCARHVSLDRVCRPTLPSTGSSRASSPASTVLSKRDDFLPLVPPHFVSFAWRYLRVHSFCSLPGGRVHRRGLELVTRYLQPGFRCGNDRTSQVPGEPNIRLHMIQSDSGRTAGTRPSRCRSMAPGMKTAEAPTKGLSKLNSMAFGLAAGTVRSRVGFAVRVTHAPRKTRFRPLVRRYRTGFPPARFLRKASDLFPTSHSPFPSFLAQFHRPEQFARLMASSVAIILTQTNGQS